MRRNRLTVNIIDEQKKLTLSAKKIKEFAKIVLRRYGVKNAQINILITDGPRMRALNKKFLKKETATDVLSFNEGADFDTQMRADIAVSADAAISRCREFKTTASDEIKLYIIHAILHILGYDDQSRSEAEAMRKEEEGLLARLCGMEIS